MKQNLKPYAYKQSEHYLVVGRQWSVVGDLGRTLGSKRVPGGCSGYRRPVTDGRRPKCDGVLFVERAGELLLQARLREFKSRSRSESES